MFKLGQTYINSKNAKSASAEDFAGKRFIAAALMSVSLGVLSLQAGFVLNANAEGSPITAPTPTAALSTIQCPIGKIAKVIDSTIICVSQNQTQNQSTTQNNNQNQNVVATGGNSSSSSSVNVTPVTAPEVSPSPSPSDSENPITAPEATPTSVPSSQPQSNTQPSSNSGPSNNGGGSPSSSCNNEAPKAAKIISATSANKNEITLFWEKAQGPVTHYSLSYGFMKSKPLYGVTNIGNVTSYTVKGLSAGVTYYFQVNAVNGCTAGPASNEIGIKGGGKFINTPAVGFKPAAAVKTLPKTSGKTVQFKNTNSNPVVKVNESPKPISIKFESGNTLNPGLLGKAVSFIKGFIN